MPYVQRDDAGRVVATLRWPSPSAQEFLADDHADIIAFRTPPEPSYRDKRKAAYIAELGEVPDFTDTVGDVLDDLIREVRALADRPATVEFGELVGKIDAIKARFPKD